MSRLKSMQPSAFKPPNLREQEEFHQTFLDLVAQAQEILQQNQVEVSDEFITTIVKLVALDPPNKFLIRQQMVPSELERLRKLVVDRILGMSPLTRDIITLQLYQKLNYFGREEQTEFHKEEIEAKVRALIDDIKDEIPEKSRRQKTLWYNKLLGATILEANMGDVSKESVVKETEAALQSVFPKEDMHLLLEMGEEDREIELYNYMHVSIGLRLYNKVKDPHFGKVIEEVLAKIPQRVVLVLEMIHKTSQVFTQRLIKYTTVTQPYFLRHIVHRMGRRAVDSTMVKVREGLTMVHQILIYLREMSHEIEAEQENGAQLIATFYEILEDIERLKHHKGAEEEEEAEDEDENGNDNDDDDNETVTITVDEDDKDKEEDKAVATAFLYPKFVELMDAWQELQEIHIFVDSTNQMLKTMDEFATRNLPAIDEIVESLTERKRVPTEKEFFRFPPVKLPEDKYALAKRVDFREDLSPLQMSLKGFCIHSLVKGVGMLVLSNTEIGIFNWKNQNYLLSSVRGAVEFRRDPDQFVKKAYAIARRCPELIALLNIEREVFDPDNISEADRSGKTTNVMITNDAEVQTELHPIESNIVKSYTWNEWELRRRGLILSKIHKCRTHGTQTHWQALKHTANVQTYANKHTSAQTNRNVYSEIPLSQFYIYGLRGLNCDVPPHVVELTTENPMDLKATRSFKNPKKVEEEYAYPPFPPIW